ncbi:serine/threonine-protein kinase [Spirillospora sp. CA-294931]|uniref:serine/threonine-protein kinase n=1 Tax=Spirillospora sp. CA-294931 TaxID=3240042 RepID=UPI003D8BC13D
MPNETTGERLLAHRYRLVTQVGRGGMGTVWQAHDEVLGRDVAVKEVILPHGLTDEERAVHHKRTFREARTAARLGHPGVITVYDVVEEDGRPWIIMELLKVPSLDQVIKREGTLEPRRAADIGRQMLAALHAAHEAGVLHRDVKPSNVLVTKDDRAVLTDFGIATASGDATLTQTGLVMGSPAYIAPERARGRTAGPASDLWSLGVTLFAMLHGKSPFERSEPMAALVAVISEAPDPPDKAGRLRPLIEGLLHKNPDQRMDAIEAGALLDEIVRQETVDTQRTIAVEYPLPEQAPPPPAPEHTKAAMPIVAEPPVESWDPPPATEPAGSLAPPSRREPSGIAGRGGLVVIAVIVLAIVLAISALAFAASRGDDKPSGKQNKSTPPATPSSPAPSKKPSTTPTASTVPEGFRLHKDKTGYSVAVPEDWDLERKGSAGDFFRSPDRRSYIQIGQTSSPGKSAIDDWRRQERGGVGFSGYKRIRIDPTGDQPPVPDTGNGDKSSDWEFTHDGDSGRTHVLNRGFVANGHGYAILLSTPDSEWSARFAQLAPVYSSFKPASD